MSKNRKLNDAVEGIHRMLMEDEQYRRYLLAVYDWGAVEGSMLDDDCMAALMLRHKAREIGIDIVGAATLAAMRQALKTVLRRFGADRRERRFKMHQGTKGEGFTMGASSVDKDV